MALKPFSIRGIFSGRSTPVAGGPRLSKDRATMEVDILQRVRMQEKCICRIESVQKRHDVVTRITLFPLQDGKAAGEPIEYIFTSRF